MNLRPLKTQILVKLIEDGSEQKAGEIYIPNASKNQVTVYATVEALGSGVDSHGKLISFNVKVGDKVLMPRYTQMPSLKSGKDIFVITNEDEILGIAEE